MNYRIIHSDNGTLKDLSHSLNKYTSGSEVIPLSASEDYLYIGSRYPFNSLYFKAGVANSVTSVLYVSYWDGNKWQGAVEIADATNGFKNSGYISFVPSRRHSGWTMDNTRNGDEVTENITGLGGLVVYDMYWMRIKCSVDLSGTTSLSWLGHIFCDDEDLYSEYPLFNSSGLKSAFKSGKTDWEEQRVRASILLVEDLVSGGIIEDQGQLLDTSKLRTSCVTKTAQLIFNALGDDYIDDSRKAYGEYNTRLKKGLYNIDSNDDAILDNVELDARQGYLVR